LLVCHPTFARRCGLTILAWIASVAITHEAAPMGSQEICVGKGLAAAFRQATAGLGMKVSRQYCDIDGDRYREHEFSYAILRVPGTMFENAGDYVAPRDAWGQVGAASGPLLTSLPLITHARGFSPGPWPMVWSGSENGKRGAMVLHLEQANR
jgi:3-oxoacyl-[acyl-carrier-protein] synthase-1